MTTVTLFTDDEGFERGFEVKGHSGFKAKGSDVVCAAVSVLTINTVNSIDEFTRDDPRVVTDDDEALISCIFDEKPSDDARLLLKSFALGIGEIARSHGKNVRTETRRYKP